MILTVDPASSASLFEQLAASIRAEIGRRALVPGERLPAAREVASSLDVNVHTVLRAYQLLRDEGLVDLRRGRGAVITERAAQFSPLAASIPALVAEARSHGLTVDQLVSLIRKEFSS
jgi:GntR family transcriptional regulator